MRVMARVIVMARASVIGDGKGESEGDDKGKGKGDGKYE